MTFFQALYERYAQDVFRFALYLSGNRAHAEDITSETFVKAWTSLEKIRAGTVKAYLFTIARNSYRELLRKESRRVELDRELRDPRPQPDEIAGNRSDLQLILEAVQKLPEAERAALLMRAQDALSHEEIAAALDVSVAAVKVRIHRARIRLKKLLSERRGAP
jgi:RNA polymerase sigma-70 factor (ECF subfamily)